MSIRTGAIRHFASIKNGSTPASGEQSYWEGGILWATPDDLGKLAGNFISETKRTITALAVDENNLSVVPRDTVLISTRAPIGHMGITRAPMAFNQGCRALIPKNGTHGPYLFYLLKSRVPELNASANGTTFVELSRDDLAATRISLPPPDTQKCIAAFLDEKTARIDALIERKQALLERLAEKRQAIITQAVTKGLNPAAPMKPSGINWLGDIPSHWQVVPIRRVARLVSTGRTPPSVAGDYFTDGVVPWFTPGDFRGDLVLSSAEKCLVEEAFAEGLAVKYPPNAVLLVGIGATLGKVARSTLECSTNQQINVISVDEDNDPGFLTCFLHAFRSEVRVAASGNTLPILNQDKTKSLLVTRPPKDEQAKIVSHIAKHEIDIEAIAGKILRSVEFLLEQRYALITAAVAGQIEGLQ